MKIEEQIAKELNIREGQVKSTIELIDAGNTIPFIARYRKEVTGNLSDEVLRTLGERLTYLRNLEQRKQEVIKIIEEQGKLTEELKKSIEEANILAEVEDLYRPFKQKKRTRATIAKEKNLDPLAQIILEQKELRPIEEIAKEFINPEKKVETQQDAIQGAMDIIAEIIADKPEYRKEIKRICYREGRVVTTVRHLSALVLI